MNTIRKYREAVAGHYRRARARAYGVFAAGLAVFQLGGLGRHLLDEQGLAGPWADAGLAVTLMVTIASGSLAAAWYLERPSRGNPSLPPNPRSRRLT